MLVPISKWRQRAVLDVNEDEKVLAQAKEFVVHGLKVKDALHLACAVCAMCECFLTTDDHEEWGRSS